MKAKIILLFCLVLTINLMAETIFWEESFDTDPGTWILDSNWSISNGYMRLYYYPVVSDYDLSAVSPVIQLPENVSDLIVTQYLNVFTIEDEVAQIILIHSEGSEVLWDYEMSLGNWGNYTGTEIIFPLQNYGGQEIQLQFRSFGESTWNFNSWDIFNLSITAMLDNDMAASDLEGPNKLQPGESGTWSVEVRNNGILAQDTFSVELYKYGAELIGSETFTQTLNSGETLSVDFTWIPEEPGNTCVYAEVFLENDENLPNNVTDSSYLRVSQDDDLNVLVWDNDNFSAFIHPETDLYTGCEQGITEALDLNGIDYELQSVLPLELDNFDIIFVTLGLYCLG